MIQCAQFGWVVGGEFNFKNMQHYCIELPTFIHRQTKSTNWIPNMKIYCPELEAENYFHHASGSSIPSKCAQSIGSHNANRQPREKQLGVRINFRNWIPSPIARDWGRARAANFKASIEWVDLVRFDFWLLYQKSLWNFWNNKIFGRKNCLLVRLI